MAELTGRLLDLTQTMSSEIQQQMQSDWGRLSTQVDAARAEFGQALAEHIDPKLASIGGDVVALQAATDATRQNVDATKQHVAIVGTDIAALYGNVEAAKQIGNATLKLAEAAQEELAKPTPPLTYILPPELQQQMRDHWYQIAGQIEASRASVDRLFNEQVAGKMTAFEQALAETRHMVQTVREEFMQPQKTVFTLPPELQKQMHDHWQQVATQIEASRASLVETISHQVDQMETRLSGKSVGSLSKTASDYATQRQIEQQTQILSELVATLGVLDAHMQQIKTEMHQGIGRA
jgi:hypothetical protein